MNAHEATILPDIDAAQTSFPDRGASLVERTAKMATVAAAEAEMVDREASFPRRAFDIAREQKLLGVMIPVEFGGFGASIHDVTDICYTLGRACASTAMIYAMHQTKVACIIRHGHGIPWMETMMRRIGRDQWLLASSTTEGQNGGNIRSSAAAVGHDGYMVCLAKGNFVPIGGTSAAAIQLIRKLGANVAAALFFIELSDLEGRSRLFGVPVQSLVQF